MPKRDLSFTGHVVQPCPDPNCNGVWYVNAHAERCPVWDGEGMPCTCSISHTVWTVAHERALFTKCSECGVVR